MAPFPRLMPPVRRAANQPDRIAQGRMLCGPAANGAARFPLFCCMIQPLQTVCSLSCGGRRSALSAVSAPLAQHSYRWVIFLITSVSRPPGGTVE